MPVDNYFFSRAYNITTLPPKCYRDARWPIFLPFALINVPPEPM